MQNLIDRARETWRGLTPFVRETITVALSVILLFLLASAACSKAHAQDYTATLQPGHTGYWYDPANPGTGLSLVVAENGVVAATVYTFNPNAPQPGAGVLSRTNHLFYVGVSPVIEGRFGASFNFSTPIDGQYLGASGDVVSFGVGSIYTDNCETLRYNLPNPLSGFRYRGTFVRLTPPVTTCQLDCSDLDFSPRPPQCPAR